MPLPSSVDLRDATPDDLDALYVVCLRTGDAGDDAAALYRDPTLLGSIYVGPYVALAEGVGFVVRDTEGVGGYVLAAPDTRRFEAAAERDWWPSLRAAHREPRAVASRDDVLVRAIHHPEIAPDELLDRFPAHLHIDLLPRMQGRGIGGALMAHLFDHLVGLGVPGVHLGVAPTNVRAIGFYRHLGFETIPTAAAGLFMARSLGDADRFAESGQPRGSST